MAHNYMAYIVGALLAAICITATIAENCRLSGRKDCANGSTIALTVVLSLALAVTSVKWFKPVFMPPTA